MNCRVNRSDPDAALLVALRPDPSPHVRFSPPETQEVVILAEITCQILITLKMGS